MHVPDSPEGAPRESGLGLIGTSGGLVHVAVSAGSGTQQTGREGGGAGEQGPLWVGVPLGGTYCRIQVTCARESVVRVQ